MTLLKKVDPEWNPTEGHDFNKFPNGFNVGDTIEISDYRDLVRSGAAILVDEAGNEIPLPGQVFACPICYRGTGTLGEFVAHVDEHKKAPVATIAPVSEEDIEISEEPVEPEEEIVNLEAPVKPVVEEKVEKNGKTKPVA